MQEHSDVFISYKRSDGTMLAKFFRTMLEEQGYRVFLDLKELRNGRFDTQLREVLAHCGDVLCVLTPDYIASMRQEPGEDNWVGLELVQALDEAEPKNIIPITVDTAAMPERGSLFPAVADVGAYEAVRYNSQGTHEEEAAFLTRLTNMLTSTPRKVNYLKHITNSGYSSTFKPEQRRLRLQAQYSTELDRQVFQYALERLPRRPLVGLDLGCADGTVTRKRFGCFDRFETVIGVDKNADAIAATQSDGVYRFRVADAESDDFETAMEQVLADAGVDGVDLVFSALTVHHMTDPIRALTRLRRFVRPGGAILLRGVDDGTMVSYGDEGLAERCIELSMGLENMSDRYHGRKFYAQLLRAGYEDVKMFFTTDCTVGMDDEERDELYRYYFNFRSNYTAKLLAAHPGERHYAELDAAMRTALSQLRDRFEDEQMFMMLTSIAAVGFAP